MPGILPSRRRRRTAREPPGSRCSTVRPVVSAVAMTACDGSEQIPHTLPERRGTLNAMSGEAQLMLMIAGMHLLGLVCVAVLIIPALREEPGAPPRNDSGSDD